MPIVGFNLTKISVERKEVISGKIDIKSRIDVTDIRKENVDLAPGKDAASINFLFEILYEPGFAKLDFRGNVLFLEDPKKIKDLVKDWKKKKIDLTIKEQAYNLILRRCNIKAFSLEEDLNLPTHFPMPRISKEGQ